MDITSFILGIFFVIVVASVAVMVIGSIKNVYDELKAIQDADDKRWSEHRRSLDSRLDKIISRVQILEKKIDDSKQFDGQTFDVQIKALDSGLHTLQHWSRDFNTKLLSRIETLEKQSGSVNKNKQLLND